jgi:phosphate transport system protein
VAQDLRLVVGALRMVIDLERIGDEAAGIAKRTIIVQEKFPKGVMALITCLIKTAKDSYQKAVAAFKNEDTPAALAIIESDNECVQKEFFALHRIMEHFCGNTGGTRGNRSQTGMHGILICRSLNRICRRSANIAEHTYFIAQGVNIKHGPPPERDKPE